MGGAYGNGIVAAAEGGAAWAGRDEAFGNAMSAMYWAGYWTAVYHVCTCSFPALIVALILIWYAES